MKITDLLRSASPRMMWLRIYFAIVVIVLCCCNPVKKVQKDPAKVQKVVDYYLRTSPIKIDTLWGYKPGDTVTKLIIGYDTTHVRDTVNHRDTVRITERITKTITRVDTVERRIDGGPLLQAAQKALLQKEADVQTARGQTADARGLADKWKIRFIILAGCIIIGGLGFVVFKLATR